VLTYKALDNTPLHQAPHKLLTYTLYSGWQSRHPRDTAARLCIRSQIPDGQKGGCVQEITSSSRPPASNGYMTTQSSV